MTKCKICKRDTDKIRKITIDGEVYWLCPKCYRSAIRTLL